MRKVRDDAGFSREMVVRRPELDPPITTKTLERWEAGARVKTFRYKQLALIYGVAFEDLRDARTAA